MEQLRRFMPSPASLLAVASALCLIFASPVLTTPSLANDEEGGICWKSSHTPPPSEAKTCPSGTSEHASSLGLCYENCKDGYSFGGAGVCYSNCPDGFSDFGVGCSKPEPYGRGIGYGWEFGDDFNNDGMLERCQENEGVECEMGGVVAYPKCREGFHTVGWNVCSPDCPGDLTDSGVSCTKHSYILPISTPPDCADGKEKLGALCYDKCAPNEYRVGLTCWGRCPASHPVACGAACATDDDACARETVEMVTSVLDIATEVATGGTGGAALKGAKTLTKVGLKEATKTAIKTMKEKVKGLTKEEIKKKIGEAVLEYGKTVGENVATDKMKEDLGKSLEAVLDPEKDDHDEDEAEIDPTVLDPTGIAAVVKAYNHPICKADDDASAAHASDQDQVKQYGSDDPLAVLYATLSVDMAKVGQQQLGWKNAPDSAAPDDSGRGIDDFDKHLYWARSGANRKEIPRDIAARLKTMLAMPDQEAFASMYAKLSVDIAKVGHTQLGWIDGSDAAAPQDDAGRGITDYDKHLAWAKSASRDKIPEMISARLAAIELKLQ
jgi:ribosomal protein L7/L12